MQCNCEEIMIKFAVVLLRIYFKVCGKYYQQNDFFGNRTHVLSFELIIADKFKKGELFFLKERASIVDLIFFIIIELASFSKV